MNMMNMPKRKALLLVPIAMLVAASAMTLGGCGYKREEANIGENRRTKAEELRAIEAYERDQARKNEARLKANEDHNRIQTLKFKASRAPTPITGPQDRTGGGDGGGGGGGGGGGSGH